MFVWVTPTDISIFVLSPLYNIFLPPAPPPLLFFSASSSGVMMCISAVGTAIIAAVVLNTGGGGGTGGGTGIGTKGGGGGSAACVAGFVNNDNNTPPIIKANAPKSTHRSFSFKTSVLNTAKVVREHTSAMTLSWGAVKGPPLSTCAILFAGTWREYSGSAIDHEMKMA